MSDDTVVSGATPVAGEGSSPPAATGGIRGFFKTTLGRVLLIGCGLATILTIVGVVVVLVLGATLFGSLSDSLTGGAVVSDPGAAAPGASVPASGAPGATVSTVPPLPPTDNEEVFTFRDPFKPVAAPKKVVPATTGSSSAHDNILTLTDIVTVSGARRAVLMYNGTTYTLGPGEAVPGTPWEVYQVNASNVVMLYGDDRVTLSVGQGISK
ncbi:MAG: hypothetical protein Q7W30_09540 [Coriobacteriia bacterium]|nr:hypothetical protein [Coriobacteriia bacterium]